MIRTFYWDDTMLGLMQSTTSWISLQYVFALKVKDMVFQLALRDGEITSVEEMSAFDGG